MKIEDINTSNISNMNKKEIKHLLEKLYPIYPISQIDNLDIVLNTNMDIKHKKLILEFIEIYKERDEIIGHLEKEKNSSMYKEITKGFGEIRTKNIFKIFTGIEEYHLIGMDFLKEKNNLEFKIDNQLYYNIRITTMRKIKNKYFPHYFEGEKYVDFYYKRLIDNLPKIFINLETHGNLIIMYLFPSYKMIKIYYLLTIMFEEVYLVFRHIIVCKKFKNNIQHLKYITEIIQNDYNFSFTKDLPMNSIFDYLKYHIQYDLYFKNELIVKKNKKIYDLYWLSLYYLLKKLNINLLKKEIDQIDKIENKFNKDFFIKSYYLSQIFLKKKCQVLSIGFSNDIYQYKKHINPGMKLFILLDNFNIDKDKDLSDIHILNVHKQKKNIFDTLIQLSNHKNKFDYIFINMILDYNHMLYYSMFIHKLLKPNSYYIIKNAHFDEINQCVIQIEKTIKDFKMIKNLGNIVIFQYFVK